MANINPKDFTTVSSLIGVETFPVYQSGWKKTTLPLLATYLKNVEKFAVNVVDISSYSGEDFGEQFNAALTANGKTNQIYTTSAGTYTLNTPVDLTNSRNLFIDLRGSTINVSMANSATYNKFAFDCTDVQDMIFYYGNIFGLSDGYQDGGILHADTTGGGDGGDIYNDSVSERNTFIGGNITGYWKVATVVHQGREISRWQGYYTNCSTTGGAFAISRSASVYSGGSLRTIESYYKGSLALGGSPTKTWMSKSTIFSRVNVGEWLLYIQGSSGKSKFDDVEFRSQGEPCVWVQGDIDKGYTFDNFYARMGVEGSGGNPSFLYVPSGSTITEVILNGRVELNAGYFASGSGYIHKARGTVNLGTSMHGSTTSMKNCDVYGVGMASDAYLDVANSENKFSFLIGRGRVTDQADQKLIGTGNATAYNTSGPSLHVTSSGTRAMVENWTVTTSALDGILAEGSYGKYKDINISATRNSIIIRGSYNSLVNVSVPVGGSGESLNIETTATKNVVIGGVFTGNVTFQDTASYNILIGCTIIGNVSFEAGAGHNKLIGCTYTGTWTDSNGTNTAI